MRLTKRWVRVATACAAGAVALGVGTVAAQSGEPWWYEVFQAGPDFSQSEAGEVAIVMNGIGGLHWMSGNLGRARNEFPETGEYIGCQIITDPNDGQFVTCTGKDAAGSTLECTIMYEPGEFELRQHMMLNAAVNLTDSHYVAVGVSPQSGECSVLQVMASSADFLAPREPLSECTESNSVDLGAFGGSPVSVPNNACVKITKFAKPNWKYGPNRTLQLQNPTGNVYPIRYEYKQACTGAEGSGQFDVNFDNQFLPGMSDACTLFIQLQGTGNGTLSLRYW